MIGGEVQGREHHALDVLLVPRVVFRSGKHLLMGVYRDNTIE